MSAEAIPLRPGEIVTLVFPTQDGTGVHVSLVRVVKSTVDTFTVPYGSVPSSASAQFDNDAEGVRWLRGQYLLDSPEVAAARTAIALKSTS